MAENLTKEKIEEIAKNYEKIVEGKVPVIKSQKETVTEKIDPKIVQNQTFWGQGGWSGRER